MLMKDSVPMAPLEQIGTITAKGQTTVPRAVRQALGVDYGGKIAFRIDPSGVTLHRVDAQDEDPAIASFLTFLARDMERRPEALTALNADLATRIAALVGEGDVDPDLPIEGEVAL